MMMRRLCFGLGALVLSLAVATPAMAAEGESQLGGYVAGAAGWAVSFQPIIPALLPTGDAPFETTFSLSSASVKSGGNALGRGALFWPGSAAANLGPLLATGAGQPIAAAVIPPFPSFVEASAKDGARTRAVSPAASMRAFGSETRAEGDVRTPDVDVPGVLRIDSVSSNSVAEVTDVDVTSTCAVHLEGVSILDGAIKFKTIFSRSFTRSTGATSSAEGDLQVVGLTVSGVAAELTGDGVHATGLPAEAAAVPGASTPFPNSNPDAALNQALSALGATLKLTRSVEKVNGGSADRLANGVLVSINNPAVDGSRFEITLASTGSAALATLPAESTVSGSELLPSGPDLTGALSAPTSDGSAPGPFTSSRLGELALGPSSGGQLGSAGGAGSTVLASYHFGGVSWSLIVATVLISLFVARWLLGFLRTRLLS